MGEPCVPSVLFSGALCVELALLANQSTPRVVGRQRSVDRLLELTEESFWVGTYLHILGPFYALPFEWFPLGKWKVVHNPSL